jgi:hypothetical protein
MIASVLVVILGAGLSLESGVAVAEPIFLKEPPSGCGGRTFSDVPTSHTHYAGICWVAANGITTNTGTYSPGNAVNRGSMATFLYRLAGSPSFTPPSASPYTDVPTSHAHYKGITWMKAKGLTVETGTYSPGTAVNRGSMATFMYRFNKAGFAWPGTTPPAGTAYLSYGWPKDGPTTRISINPYSYNSVWQPALNAAIDDWNDESIDVNFELKNSNNKVVAKSYAYEAYGNNITYHNGLNQVIKFEIELNSTLIASHAINVPNFIRSVFTHELAHATWLEDNPGGASLSVMNEVRNRNSMPSLQGIDVSRINTKY